MCVVMGGSKGLLISKLIWGGGWGVSGGVGVG